MTLPTCPHCAQPMRPKGGKANAVVARVGELNLERSYSYCPACRHGLFPLDEQPGLRSGSWSEQVARQAVWMYGHASGAVAVKALKRLAGIDHSEACLWRSVERWDMPIEAYEQVRQASANALPLRGEAGPTV